MQGTYIRIGDKVKITTGNRSLGTASGTTGIVREIEIVTFPARWWKRLFFRQEQEWRTIFHLKGKNGISFSTYITSVGRDDIAIEKL